MQITCTKQQKIKKTYKSVKKKDNKNPEIIARLMQLIYVPSVRQTSKTFSEILERKKRRFKGSQAKDKSWTNSDETKVL